MSISYQTSGQIAVQFAASQAELDFALIRERGGDNEVRTRDLLLARQALSQLSYTPDKPGGPGWTRTSDLTIISRVL